MFKFFSRKVDFQDYGIFHGMADYHSHLLPGVDDGVKTLSETQDILSVMERQGFREVWFTPHIMEDIPNTTRELKSKFEEVKAAYRGSVSLHLAAEYMMDYLFKKRLYTDDLLSIKKDGKHYLLVETSYFNPPMDLYSILEQIRHKGYYSLLAHPERYEYMRMDDYRTLKEKKVLFQLNFPALTGMYGKGVRKKAEALLKAGMYDFVGNDIHSIGYLRYMFGVRV